MAQRFIPQHFLAVLALLLIRSDFFYLARPQYQMTNNKAAQTEDGPIRSLIFIQSPLHSVAFFNFLQDNIIALHQIFSVIFKFLRCQHVYCFLICSPHFATQILCLLMDISRLLHHEIMSFQSFSQVHPKRGVVQTLAYKCIPTRKSLLLMIITREGSHQTYLNGIPKMLFFLEFLKCFHCSKKYLPETGESPLPFSLLKTLWHITWFLIF